MNIRVGFAAWLAAFVGPAAAQLGLAGALELPAAPLVRELLAAPVVAVGSAGGDLERTTDAAVRALSQSSFRNFGVHQRVLRVQAAHFSNPSTELLRQAQAGGADVLLVIRSNGSGQRSVPANQSEQICSSRKYNANPLQKALGLDCEQFRTDTIYCNRETQVLRLQFEIFQPSTGRSLHLQDMEGTGSHTNCSKSGAVNKSRDVLLEEAFAQISLQIPALLQARPQSFAFSLGFADSPITSAGLGQRFAEAAAFLSAGRNDRACSDLNTIAQTAPASVAALRGLAICDVVHGQFSTALRKLQQVESVLSAPDAQLARQIAQVQAALAAELVLARRADYKVAVAPQYSSVVIAQALGVPAGPAAQKPVLLPADSGSRVALVIGNSAYSHVSSLANPSNDARDMRDALRAFGFAVEFVENASRNQMLQAINRFGDSLTPRSTAFVFFAGHGIQVRGENFLMPVDANPKSEVEVELEAVNLGRITAKLEKSGVNILVLDACRNDPFKRSWRSSARGGLASVDAPKGTLIAYATAPGAVADDGAGRNSPYSAALLRAMQEPNVKVEDVFKRVRREVAQVTRNQQIPWESSSMTGDFYFSIQNAAAPISTPPSTAWPALPAAPQTLTLAPVAEPLAAAPASQATRAAVAQPSPVGIDPMSLQGQCASRPNPISKAICERRACEKPPLIGKPECEIFLLPAAQ